MAARASGLLGPDAAPRDLAARVHGAWVGFARSGDPGWAAYQAGSRTVHVLGR